MRGRLPIDAAAGITETALKDIKHPMGIDHDHLTGLGNSAAMHITIHAFTAFGACPWP